MAAHTYDDNGNLAFDGQFHYYYDCENRLTDINDVNDALVASYAYDYRGRRITKLVYDSPNVTTQYCYDGDQVIAEYDGSGALLRKFIYGPGIDEPICLIEVADNNAVYYYHFDGLGSVVALSDVNSVLVERYTYDVFGRPTICDANGVVIEESAYGNPYLFTARAYDTESGLYYYRARYYDYYTGRFLQPDPIGYADGLSLYGYVGNNPCGYADPSGLCKRRIRNFLLSTNPLNPLHQVMRNINQIQMTVEYYNIFRGVEYGPAEAAALAGIMTLGKAAGFATFEEGLMGINVREQREIHGLERGLYTGVGGVQTALTALGGAQLLHAFTTSARVPVANVPQVTVNKVAGNTFRDEVAGALRNEGFGVKTEVYKRTPFGKRYIDIEVSQGGRTLGGIETKVGNSPYTSSQRLKDTWLRVVEDYPVTVVRDR